MKTKPTHTVAPVTLQTVLDRLTAERGLSSTRRRDLRSGVTSFAKLRGQPPAAIPLDLADIRKALDDMEPAWAKLSRKRWANLRSDLAAAIGASGVLPMLKTADIDLDEAWRDVLARTDRRVRLGLLRFAKWASLRGILPQAVDDDTMERFVAELDGASLVRNFHLVRGTVGKWWNALVGLHVTLGLQPVAVRSNRRQPTRISWHRLPPSFREDVERYLRWAAVPEPLAEGARARALAPKTLRLQRDHIRSATTAAVAAGVPIEQLTSLASLVESDNFRTLLGYRWREDGRQLSAYTHGVTITLIAIAVEWMRAPADQIATLKALRSRLGRLRNGLTDKNKAVLRLFDDPRLIVTLVQLPDTLWGAARRGLTNSARSFIDLQTALAIDLLIHVPLRMQNLSRLRFDQHLHWPQGRGKPGLVTFRSDETKNNVVLEYEIPAALADRLYTYRNEIAPAVIGERPDAVFITRAGRPRSQAAVSVAIAKTVVRQLGVRITPHQYRHLAAKIALDANPGAYELVRQLLGHTNLRTTTSFYAGLDTRRAGRAHAELVMKLRGSTLGRRRPRRAPKPRKD
jgi:integrase